MLACEFDGSGFSEYGDFDFAGEGHLVGDSFGDLVGGEVGLVVGDSVGVDHDADFSARLDGECFGDTGLGLGDVFEVVEALDVAFHGFAACAGSCG